MSILLRLCASARTRESPWSHISLAHSWLSQSQLRGTTLRKRGWGEGQLGVSHLLLSTALEALTARKEPQQKHRIPPATQGMHDKQRPAVAWGEMGESLGGTCEVYLPCASCQWNPTTPHSHACDSSLAGHRIPGAGHRGREPVSSTGDGDRTVRDPAASRSCLRMHTVSALSCLPSRGLFDLGLPAVDGTAAMVFRLPTLSSVYLC